MSGDESVFPDYTQKVVIPKPGQAFPWPEFGPIEGLTKRELFAAMAMQGMVQALTKLNGTISPEIIQNRPKSVGEISIVYADALIAELDKEKK